jgi:hypothetical protein
MTEKIDKKAIREHLLEALNREEISNREAAKLLNIHPMYFSQIKKEEQWDGIPPSKWERFNEWHLTRCTLREFTLPEGEPIDKFFADGTKEVKPASEKRLIDEHSPENILENKKRKYTRREIKKDLLPESASFDQDQVNVLTKKYEALLVLAAGLTAKHKVLEEEYLNTFNELRSALNNQVNETEGCKDANNVFRSTLTMLVDEQVDLKIKLFGTFSKSGDFTPGEIDGLRSEIAELRKVTLKKPVSRLVLNADKEEAKAPRYFAWKNIIHIHQDK